MGRWLKPSLAVGFALVALLVVNMLVVDGPSRPAEITVSGGRILELPSGALQVAEHGPRESPPIVLIHCYTCAIDWWDPMVPILVRRHRVIAIDLLGHGGSAKPESGYDPPHQADALAQALGRLGVDHATVVGHSLGGAVGVALAQRHPTLVQRLVLIGTAPDSSYAGDHGVLATLVRLPLIGEALWRVKPDASVRKGLGVLFAPGFEVPDAFVEDVERMTYTAYDSSPSGAEQFREQMSVANRMEEAGQPLMVLMGAEEQVIADPAAALAQYVRVVPGTETHLISGAGHSPNVERPRLTARLVLRFAKTGARP
jgi:pimeloyl-ACP methyl ester carboxylesterase